MPARPDGAVAARVAARIALLVLAADAASKAAAVALLADGAVPLLGALHLTVVHNPHFAPGVDLGALTTAAVVALALLVSLVAAGVAAPLAAHDRRAPVALGLVCGAALGNAADFLHTGRGAVDFIAVGTAQGALVFNVADVAAYAGVALLAPTAWTLGRAVRAERRASRSAVRRPVADVRRRVPLEVGVPVPRFVEGALAAAAPERGPARPADRVRRPIPPPADVAPPRDADPR